MKGSYPIEIKYVQNIGSGVAQSVTNENTLLDSRGAITLYIKIDSHDYPNEEVGTAVKEICQKVVECYC